MFKRILLFLLTNILVVATVSIMLSILGVHGYLTQHGIDYASLMVFCLVWGMAGAFISLMMSRWMAKRLMGVKVIDPQRASAEERRLVEMVHGLARRAGLTTMPEVGIYPAEQHNAFATGATKNRSLVAVSAGLLRDFPENELLAILGHEITHITNGDMVTLTLIQGVVNAFAMFLSRIVAYAVAQAMRGNNDREGGMSTLTYYVCVFIFDIIFTILGSVVTAAFSRWREFRADQGGAQLSSRDHMIAALRRLDQVMTEASSSRRRSPFRRRRRALDVLQISMPGKRGGIRRYFASHPPIEERIKRLQTSA